MPTLSKFMDADIESGLIVKVAATVTYMGHTIADCVMSDGSRMAYMDANYVLLTGEIARERTTEGVLTDAWLI